VIVRDVTVDNVAVSDTTVKGMYGIYAQSYRLQSHTLRKECYNTLHSAMKWTEVDIDNVIESVTIVTYKHVLLYNKLTDRVVLTLIEQSVLHHVLVLLVVNCRSLVHSRIYLLHRAQ
jgi:hypothetical protein